MAEAKGIDVHEKHAQEAPQSDTGKAEEVFHVKIAATGPPVFLSPSL